MAIRHARVLDLPDQTEPYLVNGVEVDPATIAQPSDWDADHVIDSTGASDGDVLTADGAGGAAWVAPSGGGTPGVDYPTKTAVTLSSADILDLHNTPVELVPAPGAGKWVDAHRVSAAHLAGTPYTNGTYQGITIVSGDNVGTVADNVGRLTSAFQSQQGKAVTESATDSGDLAIYAYTDDAFTDGDFDLTVTVWYSIEDVPA